MSGFHEWIESHITLHQHDNRREEIASSIIHYLGTLLSVIGTFMMVAKAYSCGQRSMVAGLLIYGCSMIILYASSSTYHLLRPSFAKRVLRIFDHSSIYLLIAGTYTPLLAFIGGKTGLLLLIIIWLFALVGNIFTLAFWGRLKPVHVILYLAMGWMIVLFRDQALSVVPEGLLPWVIAGGVSYTVGTVFYAMKKLPYYHAIWHVFVLAGSTCFFLGYYIHLVC